MNFLDLPTVLIECILIEATTSDDYNDRNAIMANTSMVCSLFNKVLHDNVCMFKIITNRGYVVNPSCTRQLKKVIYIS